MPPVVEVTFDPLLQAGGLALRWQAIGLAVVILVATLVWVGMLQRALGPDLRFADAAFVLLGAIPGAVVGGRVVHGLDFLDIYVNAPTSLLDLGRGSLSLVGAVLGGAITAGYVCRLLGGRVGLWADASALPLLLAIGLGKLVMVAGGAGQGAAFAGPLALSFGGAGPWWSADAATPAWPSQVVEGLWCLAGVPLAWWLRGRLETGPRAGRGLLLLAALAWWLAGRVVVAVTWRDDRLMGPLGAEGLLSALALAATLLVGAVLLRSLQPSAPSMPPSIRG